METAGNPCTRRQFLCRLSLATLVLLASAALLRRPSLLLLATAKTLERDVFGLIAFYMEVKDRSPEWRGAVDKWPVHTCNISGVCEIDPCGFDWEPERKEWEGVTCRYQWGWDHSIPRVVTNIHRPKMGLNGPLPRSLQLFENITEIDFDTNKLTGPLPREFGCLRNLIEIDLTKNQLTGTIPQEWGLLSRLVEMELDENVGITGCVPNKCPPFNRLCGTFFGPPCPSFTTDRLIGTDIRNTRAMGRCSPPPGGDAALVAGLKCPVPTEFQDSIARFFAEQQQRQQQPPQAQTQLGPRQEAAAALPAAGGLATTGGAAVPDAGTASTGASPGGAANVLLLQSAAAVLVGADGQRAPTAK